VGGGRTRAEVAIFVRSKKKHEATWLPVSGPGEFYRMYSVLGSNERVAPPRTSLSNEGDRGTHPQGPLWHGSILNGSKLCVLHGETRTSHLEIRRAGRKKSRNTKEQDGVLLLRREFVPE